MPTADRPLGNDERTPPATLTPNDRVLLETPAGRQQPDDEDLGPMQEEIRDKSQGSRPVSDRTNVHLSGTGGTETDDGLDENEESLRRSAEDIVDEDAPNGDESDESALETQADDEDGETGTDDDRPVFDRTAPRL